METHDLLLIQARPFRSVDDRRAGVEERSRERDGDSNGRCFKMAGRDGFGSKDRRRMGSRPHRPSQDKSLCLILGRAPSGPDLILA